MREFTLMRFSASANSSSLGEKLTFPSIPTRSNTEAFPWKKCSSRLSRWSRGGDNHVFSNIIRIHCFQIGDVFKILNIM